MALDAETRDLSPEDVRQTCGELLDWQVQAIVDTGASPAELEAAVVRAQGGDDLVPPLAGRAAEVFDILTSDEDLEDER